MVVAPAEPTSEPKPPPTGTPPVVAEPPPVFDAGLPDKLYIRQIRTVMVDAIEETWVLRWRGKPQLSCVAPPELGTCACWPFAYAEKGNLELARMRLDEPEDVFVFSKHLEDDPELQHWIMDKDDPMDRALPIAEIKKRPVLDAMQFADYDHDGRATEFTFRVPLGGPCGHNSTRRVIGISKKNPKLHWIGPSMPQEAWDKVAKMEVPGSITYIEVPCGDHGSGTEQSVVVKLDEKLSFKTQEKTRVCGPNE